MAEALRLPRMSDTMEEGVIAEILIKVGDDVSTGDVIAEVETDKATMELENFDDGTLLELFVGEGDEVPIGSPLAVIGEVGEKYDSPNIPSTPKIENLDSMKPFFMSIVSPYNHWLFISSNGSLSAGRKNSNNALFPYYTDDKITELQDVTGNKTIIKISFEDT